MLGLTVKQLREALNKLPDDAVLYHVTDDEGNGITRTIYKPTLYANAKAVEGDWTNNIWPQDKDQKIVIMG